MTASTVDDPQDVYHRSIDERILTTLNAVRSLRSGGTAMDVRQAIDNTCRDRLAHLRTVRRDLWLLYRLGLVTFDHSDDDIRYWRSP